MQITITLDTNELTEADKATLRSLAGDAGATTVVVNNGGEKPEKAAPAAKSSSTAKSTKKAEKAPEPEPEEAEEADEPDTDDSDDAGDGPTMKEAVELATKLVSSGEAKKVKAALNAVGAKRVSELPEDKIGEFVDSLS